MSNQLSSAELQCTQAAATVSIYNFRCSNEIH